METLARNRAFARQRPPSSHALERRATVGVCVTNKQAQGDGAGDGLSFDAADEQLLSALEREEQ